jgi:uncharacterized membrane protein
MSSLSERLEDYDRRLRSLQWELAELKREVRNQEAPVEEPQPLPVPLPPPRPEIKLPPPLQQRPPRVRREIDWSDLLGARALAWAGGIVTLLGILFFFVLAVDRGWIGPVARVGLGGSAATLVFLAGLELRRRYGETHSSLAAVGAGIAGWYATLLCADALYHLIPDAAALVLAAGIGAIGLATALAWSSELIAGVGLVGAALAPVAVAAQGGQSGAGTAFAAIVLAAIVVVATRKRWLALLIVGTVATWPQLQSLVADYERATWWLLLLIAGYALCYLGACIEWNLRWEAPGLRKVSPAFAALSALAAATVTSLYDDELDRGLALLPVAVGYALLAVAFFGRRRTRNLSSLLAAVALVVGTAAAALLLSGQSLAYVWAAEAAALAWLAWRARESRFQLWAFTYFGLALLHVAAIDAPPSHLFDKVPDPAQGALTAVALAAAALTIARNARVRRRRGKSRLEELLRTLQGSQRRVRETALWSAGVLVAYAAALGLIQLFGFDWGHVAISAMWAAAGLGIVAAAVRLDSRRLEAGGLIWLGVVAFKAFAFDVPMLGSTALSCAALAVATCVFASAVAVQFLRRPAGLAPECGAYVIAALALSMIGAHELAPSRALEGVALLGLAAVYASVSAWAFRRGNQRDFSTLLWAIALAVAAVGTERLLTGTLLVVAWAALGTAAALIATAAPEPRLRLGTLALLGLALGTALALEAPPSDLFVAQSHPAAGVPALLAVLVGAVITLLTWRGDAAAAAWWATGVIALYAASLTVLEVVQNLSSASLETDFQRGHSAVSAMWGLLGLTLLYLGLTRRPSLRLAGFALFGISLAKIFLYDLPALSSITRALSFLAVGAVLLLGGFFYQRLLETKT